METLRDLTSAVLQDVFLFHTTIRENIRLGRPDATDEEVEEAAKKAYAHDFIMGLPEGYDTVTGERGFRLSGGQRQRISIARAILRDAPILILDEAVCSLDTENERLIQAALDAHAKGRTTIVIAHRMSTIRNADRLVVIQQGKVVQTGTHEKLLHERGFYQQLMAHQLDLQRTDKDCPELWDLATGKRQGKRSKGAFTKVFGSDRRFPASHRRETDNMPLYS